MKRALLLALLAGCGGPTEIVVRVETLLANGAPLSTMTGAKGNFDFVCFDLQEVAPPFGTVIQPPKGDPTWSSSVPASTTCAPVELAVVSSGGSNHEPFGIRVRGSTSCDSTTDAYLQTSGSTVFEEGRVSLLTLTLTDKCTADPSDKTAAQQITQCSSTQTCNPDTGSCETIVPVAPLPYRPPAACP